MKTINYQYFITILFILINIFSCNNNRQTIDVSNHFILAPKPKITIETDNNSINLNANGLTGFSNCKPYLAWRYEGIEKWTEDISTGIKKENISETEERLICSVGPVLADITIKKLEDNVFEFSGSMINKSGKIIVLDRFHYLDGIIDHKDAKFIGYENFGVTNNTDTIEPLSVTFKEKMKISGANFPVIPDPIHDGQNWSSSLDAGIFASGINEPGWFIGATGPCSAYGEIGFKTQVIPSPFYAGVLLDNIILEPDSSRVLEKLIVYAGNWQEGMSYWIKQTAKEMNLKKQKHPLVGYCSWYQRKQRVLPTDIFRANAEFNNLPIPPGGRTIQIDDGFQIMPGNWLPNSRFEKDWKSLPGKIAETGAIPGVWFAPTAIHETHPLVKEHPEMLQQFSKDTDPVWFKSWQGEFKNGKWIRTGKKTYFLDIDRPDSKKFMENIMKNAINEGWRYFKIDYTYSLSNARIAWNKKKTTVESKRDLFKLLRKTGGSDILINACLGFPERFALGYADIARIGKDIGSHWSSVKSNLPELLIRSCSNGYWWQVDPDVFYMRSENSNLNSEENFLLTGSIGLIGGTFLTSDFPSQWSPEAKKVVKSFWTKEGPTIPTRSYVLCDKNGQIKAYLVSYYEKKEEPQHRLGIYNLSDNEEKVQIDLKDLKLKPSLNWSIEPFSYEQSIKLEKGSIIIENQPPHSLRIINLSVKE